MAKKVYTGEWHACQRHGEGELVSEFATYTGAWAYDSKHGYGTQSSSKGEEELQEHAS